MRITPERKIDALLQTLAASPAASWDGIVELFLRQLLVRGEKGELTKIKNVIERRAQGEIPLVTVRTAHAHHKKFLQPFVESVTGTSDAIIKRVVDPALVGGVQIEFDMSIVRGAVRDHLEQLKNFLHN